jgi:hypothetical protein
MNTNDAIDLARAHLSNDIGFEPCDAPEHLYNSTEHTDHLFFRVTFHDPITLGGFRYVAVCRSTGKVDYLGIYGE